MERIGRALRTVLHHLRDTRGVSLYEITAAVAMTGILAAVAVPVIIDKVSEAKQARTVQETDAIYRAMTAFQRDTGKMPGEAQGKLVLVSGAQGFFAELPTFTPVTGGVTSFFPAQHPIANLPACVFSVATSSTGKCANLNDYLVRNPNPTDLPVGTPPPYPNWRGPYADEILNDPFDRAYIVNVGPLYKPEIADTGGKCGYAWVLSAGPDRTLNTGFGSTNLLTASDDIGKNNGKKIGGGTGC